MNVMYDDGSFGTLADLACFGALARRFDTSSKSCKYLLLSPHATEINVTIVGCGVGNCPLNSRLYLCQTERETGSYYLIHVLTSQVGC
jgi:hypothetical protein